MQRSFFGPGFQGFATILQQIQYIVPPSRPRITVYESMKTENDLVKVFLQSQSRRT